MPVETGELVKEISVEWKPKGYLNSRVLTTIRNGFACIHGTSIAGDYVIGDIDGCIEFLEAIKKAIDNTK